MVSAGRLLGLVAWVGALASCGPLVVGVGFAASGAGVAPARASSGTADVGVADIPAAVLAVYRAAVGECAGLGWSLLAGIGKVESDHGRIYGAVLDPVTFEVAPPIVGIALDGRPGIAAIETPPGGSRWHGDPTWDHAVGPMQFITGTWQAWAVDANGDGVASPHNLADAAYTAARYLCGGAPALTDRAAAVGRYNHSVEYVAEVLAWADRYHAAEQQTAIAAGVVLPAGAQEDIDAGRVDRRVVGLLSALGATYQIEVSVLVSGHSECVGGGDRAERPGCAVSNHWYGRAVDIAAVDGAAVTADNLPARRLLEQLLALPVELRPTEIGGPWDDLAGVFSDAGHQDHLHIGWDS